MKRFCKDLRENAMKIIYFEKRNDTAKFYEKKKDCYMCKKCCSADNDNGIAFNKKYHIVRDHCHYTKKSRRIAHSICNLRYKTLK